jgi:carbonic anhydrase/acetyltransferase-like protein (isoleucine patch superfamily)
MTDLLIHTLHVQILRVSGGEQVEVNSFVVPSSGFQIVMLCGEVELVSKVRVKPGSGVEIDASEVSSHIRTRFSDQVVLHSLHLKAPIGWPKMHVSAEI